MTDLTNTELSLDNTTDTSAEQYDPAHDYHALNAMLNLYDADGKIQFDKDKAAEREYVTGHVAANSKQFDSTAERLDYLISNQYYNPASSAHVRAQARCTSTPTTRISCDSWTPSERTRMRRSASSHWRLAW